VSTLIFESAGRLDPEYSHNQCKENTQSIIDTSLQDHDSIDRGNECAQIMARPSGTSTTGGTEIKSSKNRTCSIY
jgi:hypothetical protein